MGNAPSTKNTKKKKQQGPQHRPRPMWDWTYKDGRVAGVTPRAKTMPRRPLFVKQPSNNYDWWYANPKRNNSKN